MCEKDIYLNTCFCHSLAVTSSKFSELFEPVSYSHDDDGETWGCDEGG